jgi:hypothetical protein
LNGFAERSRSFPFGFNEKCPCDAIHRKGIEGNVACGQLLIGYHGTRIAHAGCEVYSTGNIVVPKGGVNRELRIV